MSSSWIRRALGKRLGARLDRLRWNDAGHGYDRLGLHPDWVRATVAASRPLYDAYFRVTSHGIENVPADGPVVIAANHSGMLPFDGAMLWTDLVRNLDPPRVPRVIADTFVPMLPFVWTLFSRTGVVSGNRATVRALLDDGEILMIFPEGTPGISKPFRDRYHLQAWRVGHAELALRHRAPVVPVAIIGAEEQWPQIARLDVHPFGAPFLPIPATPLPLPVHYHIHYGAPIALHELCAPDAADDPEIAEEAAAIVKVAVQALIDHGLEQRPGVFR